MKTCRVTLICQADQRLVAIQAPVTVIGRSNWCHIRLEERRISRRHCKLQLVGDELRVFDLSSANGIYVNGARLITSVLQDGDTLRVGRTEFLVQITQEEAIPAAPPAPPEPPKPRRVLAGPAEWEELADLLTMPPLALPPVPQEITPVKSPPVRLAPAMAADDLAVPPVHPATPAEAKQVELSQTVQAVRGPAKELLLDEVQRLLASAGDSFIWADPPDSPGFGKSARPGLPEAAQPAPAMPPAPPPTQTQAAPAPIPAEAAANVTRGEPSPAEPETASAPAHVQPELPAQTQNAETPAQTQGPGAEPEGPLPVLMIDPLTPPPDDSDIVVVDALAGLAADHVDEAMYESELSAADTDHLPAPQDVLDQAEEPAPNEVPIESAAPALGELTPAPAAEPAAEPVPELVSEPSPSPIEPIRVEAVEPASAEAVVAIEVAAPAAPAPEPEPVPEPERLMSDSAGPVVVEPAPEPLAEAAEPAIEPAPELAPAAVEAAEVPAPPAEPPAQAPPAEVLPVEQEPLPQMAAAMAVPLAENREEPTAMSPDLEAVSADMEKEDQVLRELYAALAANDRVEPEEENDELGVLACSTALPASCAAEHPPAGGAIPAMDACIAAGPAMPVSHAEGAPEAPAAVFHDEADDLASILDGLAEAAASNPPPDLPAVLEHEADQPAVPVERLDASPLPPADEVPPSPPADAPITVEVPPAPMAVETAPTPEAVEPPPVLTAAEVPPAPPEPPREDLSWLDEWESQLGTTAGETAAPLDELLADSQAATAIWSAGWSRLAERTPDQSLSADEEELAALQAASVAEAEPAGDEPAAPAAWIQEEPARPAPAGSTEPAAAPDLRIASEVTPAEAQADQPALGVMPEGESLTPLAGAASPAAVEPVLVEPATAAEPEAAAAADAPAAEVSISVEPAVAPPLAAAPVPAIEAEHAEATAQDEIVLETELAPEPLAAPQEVDRGAGLEEIPDDVPAGEPPDAGWHDRGLLSATVAEAEGLTQEADENSLIAAAPPAANGAAVSPVADVAAAADAGDRVLAAAQQAVERDQPSLVLADGLPARPAGTTEITALELDGLVSEDDPGLAPAEPRLADLLPAEELAGLAPDEAPAPPPPMGPLEAGLAQPEDLPAGQADGLADWGGERPAEEAAPSVEKSAPLPRVEHAASLSGPGYPLFQSSSPPSQASAASPSRPPVRADHARSAATQPVGRPLHDACRTGNRGLAALFLGKGADINGREDKYSATPLHLACAGGHLGVIDLLLRKGADLRAVDSRGSTPLDWALACRKPTAADALREAGA